MKRLIIGGVVALATMGAGSTAFAGEVGGDGHETPIVTRRVASSLCAFNGLDDGSETGNPVTPGVVQSFGSIVAGVAKEAGGVSEFTGLIRNEGPGASCRGNLEFPEEG
jgi:hypothetical protein